MDVTITKEPHGKVLDQQSKIKEALEVSDRTDAGFVLLDIELAHDDSERVHGDMLASTLEGLARWEAKHGLTPPER